jgi:hypothetical protein
MYDWQSEVFQIISMVVWNASEVQMISDRSLQGTRKCDALRIADQVEVMGKLA